MSTQYHDTHLYRARDVITRHGYNAGPITQLLDAAKIKYPKLDKHLCKLPYRGSLVWMLDKEGNDILEQFMADKSANRPRAPMTSTSRRSKRVEARTKVGSAARKRPVTRYNNQRPETFDKDSRLIRAVDVLATHGYSTQSITGHIEQCTDLFPGFLDHTAKLNGKCSPWVMDKTGYNMFVSYLNNKDRGPHGPYGKRDKRDSKTKDAAKDKGPVHIAPALSSSERVELERQQQQQEFEAKLAQAGEDVMQHEVPAPKELFKDSTPKEPVMPEPVATGTVTADQVAEPEVDLTNVRDQAKALAVLIVEFQKAAKQLESYGLEPKELLGDD